MPRGYQRLRSPSSANEHTPMRTVAATSTSVGARACPASREATVNEADQWRGSGGRRVAPCPRSGPVEGVWGKARSALSAKRTSGGGLGEGAKRLVREADQWRGSGGTGRFSQQVQDGRPLARPSLVRQTARGASTRRENPHRPILRPPPSPPQIRVDGIDLVEREQNRALEERGAAVPVRVRPSFGLRHDQVDHAELEAVRRVGLEGRRGLACIDGFAGTPEDRGAALRRDHGVDRVLLHEDPVGDGDRDRAAGAPLTDDACDRRHGQPRHRRLGARNRASLAVLLGRDTGVCPGRVDHRDEREAVPVGERHRPHPLAVALRVRHPEVPARALLQVAPLLVPDQHDSTPLELADPGDERRVVRACAIAVELEEVVEDALDVVERVRPVLVASELDRAPDALCAGLLLHSFELVLETLELAGDLRAAQQLHGAELTQPLTEPKLGLARHQGRRKRRRSCEIVGRSSARGTIASTCPNRKFDSERAKSSGSFSLVVWATTRGPANDMRAPGSASTTSPRLAKLARTPPVVGCVSTETSAPPDSCSSSIAQIVFGSCISARIPSCMRAPPEAATHTSGTSLATALSHARANFSPTTLPIEPPRNAKSMTASRHSSPATAACGQTRSVLASSSSR